MAKRKSKLDLNGDGKFDAEDKSIAASVLASKVGTRVEKVIVEEESKVEKENKEEFEQLKKDGLSDAEARGTVWKEGRLAVKDISLTYRAGMIVPESQIELWKKSGIKYEQWF